MSIAHSFEVAWVFSTSSIIIVRVHIIASGVVRAIPIEIKNPGVGSPDQKESRDSEKTGMEMYTKHMQSFGLSDMKDKINYVCQFIYSW